jgi:hypothetical protein
MQWSCPCHGRPSLRWRCGTPLDGSIVIIALPALSINQVAALAGMFIGLVAGGVLATIDWRLVFWVNVPVGVFATLWTYRKLRDNGERQGRRIDWWGNVTFAVGLSAVLIAITNGIQPYHGHTTAWTNPAVFCVLAGGVVLLAAFVAIETKVAEPMTSSACSASGHSLPVTQRDSPSTPADRSLRVG